MRQNIKLVARWLTTGFIWKLFATLGLMLGLSSCFIFCPSPSSFPDYDNSDGFILDYAPGDKFVTLKPVFLTKFPFGTENAFSLDEPGMGAPTLEQYAQNPERFKHVIRLVPSGTKIQLIAIKDTGARTATVYAKLEGIEKWVGVGLGEYTKPTTGNWRDVRLQYNREYFRKIEEAGKEKGSVP